MSTTRAQCREERRDRHGLRQPGRASGGAGAAPEAAERTAAGEQGTDQQPHGEQQARSGHQPASAELRRVFGTFPTGVTAIAALVDGEPVGLAANSFTSVSLDPPLLSVCVAHTSTTWPALSDRARLGVTVLGAHQEQACKQLASRNGDRFAGLDWHATDDGAVVLDGGSAWFDCSIEQHIRAGDHDIVLLRIQELDADHEVAPLVFHASRFRRLEEAAESRPTPDPQRNGSAGRAAADGTASPTTAKEAS